MVYYRQLRNPPTTAKRKELIEMKNYYWTLDAWGADYPPENADEIIDAANEKIDAFIEANPDADEEQIAAYSEKLWDKYCNA